MIVVVIIGLLAVLAIPAMQRVQTLARVNSFTNDLRIGRDAFESYATENGRWPPDGGAAIPNEMDGYLKLSNWLEPTPLGGRWDWDYGVFGVTAGLSVLGPEVPPETMELVDAQIDDGNLTTGAFQSRSSGYILILEF
jgi:type II secretory pathway pseudopilin PulG